MNDSAVIIDGRELAGQVLEKLGKKVSRSSKKPTLAIIIVGKDHASEIYVRAKKKACEKIGIRCRIVSMGEKVSSSTIIETISGLNSDKKVNGIIVQLPLPNSLNEDKILNTIDKNKDVDGLSRNTKYTPATAKAVLKILRSLAIPLKGKKATVIGRSKLVGKPVARSLKDVGCIVNVCHSKTVDLKAKTIDADIIVSAVGKRGLVTKKMVKKRAIVIDVGITREGSELFGDVDSNVRKIAGFLTPVPGGVGPITVACLLENVIDGCSS